MKCDNELSIRLKKPLPSYDGGGFIYNVPAPCGKCLNCKKNRANQWAFRIWQEFQRSENGYFVTLTYNTEKVPINENGTTTLKKKDLQDFIKRLRKHEADTDEVSAGYINAYKSGIKFDAKVKIIYWAAGEYGEQRHRPHYHLILLNIRNPENIRKAWSEAKYIRYNKRTKEKEYEYVPMGMVDIGPVNPNTIDYTVKYIQKDNTKIYWKYKLGAQREFSIMSKGIGDNYVTPEIEKFHQDNPDNNYLLTQRGYKIPIPRYYRERVYTEYHREQLIPVIKKRVEENEKKERLELGDKYDNIKQLQKEARQNLLKNQIKKRNYD